MKFVYNLEEFSLNVTLENKKNIKHCYLKIISKEEIHIKANYYFSLDDAKDLLENKKSWIYKHIKTFSQKKQLKENEFYFLGTVLNKKKENIKDCDAFYRQKIEEFIPKIVKKYSNMMDLYPKAIKYRKNKRTWGSCNYKNELNFNIYLCKFPLSVIEYVVIHELAHIEHKNHSKDFWDLVKKYCFDYKNREELLKSFL